MKSVVHLCALAVGLVVLVLAGLRGLVLLGNSEERNVARAHSFLLLASSELDRWYDEAGSFPDDLNVLDCAGAQRAQVGVGEVFGGVLRAPLGRLPSTVKAVREGALLDPWGNPWQFEMDEEQVAVRLVSFGSDRAEGGEGPARDLELTKTGLRTALTHLDEEPLW